MASTTIDRTVEQGETIARRSPRLAWTDADGEHERAVAGSMTLGSAGEVDIVVADRAVSRIHAEVEPRSDGLWVCDLGSRNGTYVRDVRIDSGRVPHEAAIKVGETEIVVSYEPEPLKAAAWSAEHFGPLVGKSLVMRRLFAQLAKVAPSDASAIISGETGTGKELVARALHDRSPRKGGPFIIVDCAALPESLIEAELFGHEKGAFTGASQARVGALEAAAGGTVFLDEIGELPLTVQPKLLRALESRQVSPLGNSRHRPIDVRFVAATHRDLRLMVNEGSFREDLYFRIAVLMLDVPPLRERLDDIPLLVAHLAGSALAADRALVDKLTRRSWRGNVRELRNVLERVSALGVDDALRPPAPSAAAPDARRVPISFTAPYREVRQRWLDYFERHYFAELLARHDRDVRAAAREAGVDRTYVYRIIKRHDL